MLRTPFKATARRATGVDALRHVLVQRKVDRRAEGAKAFAEAVAKGWSLTQFDGSELPFEQIPKFPAEREYVAPGMIGCSDDRTKFVGDYFDEPHSNDDGHDDDDIDESTYFTGLDSSELSDMGLQLMSRCCCDPRERDAYGNMVLFTDSAIHEIAMHFLVAVCGWRSMTEQEQRDRVANFCARVRAMQML